MLQIKKATTERKHGMKAREAAAEASRFRVNADSDGRLKTTLTFETNSQAYLWITDRGRSRLIKH